MTFKVDYYRRKLFGKTWADLDRDDLGDKIEHYSIDAQDETAAARIAHATFSGVSPETVEIISRGVYDTSLYKYWIRCEGTRVDGAKTFTYDNIAGDLIVVYPATDTAV